MDNQTIVILIMCTISSLLLIAIGYTLHYIAVGIDIILKKMNKTLSNIIHRKQNEVLDMLRIQFGTEFINCLNEKELDSLIEANK